MVILSAPKLPAGSPVRLDEKYQVRVPGEDPTPKQHHSPEGILFDSEGRLVVSTTDGYVLRRLERGAWEQLGQRLSGQALGIANDPWGGYLLVAAGGVWHWDEEAPDWQRIARVWSANCLVALRSGKVVVSAQAGCSLWLLERDEHHKLAEVRPKPIGFYFTPNGLAVDSREETLYVACLASGRVLAVDLARRTRSLVAKLGALAYADGVVALPDGNLAVSTNRGDVFLIDTVLHKVLERVHFPAELTPANLAVRPHHQEIWFAGLGKVQWKWRKLRFGTDGEFVGSFEFGQ